MRNSKESSVGISEEKREELARPRDSVPEGGLRDLTLSESLVNKLLDIESFSTSHAEFKGCPFLKQEP